MKIFFPFSGLSVGGSHISVLNIIKNLDKKYDPVIIYHNKSNLNPFRTIIPFNFKHIKNFFIRLERDFWLSIKFEKWLEIEFLIYMILTGYEFKRP